MAEKSLITEVSPSASRVDSAEANTSDNGWKDLPFSGQVLLVFAQTQIDCKLQEVDTLAELLNTKITFNHNEFSKKSPYLLTEMESRSKACEFSQRSISIRYLVETWYQAESYEDLTTNLSTKLHPEIKSYLTSDKYSYAIHVSAFGKKLDRAYTKSVIDKLEFLDLKGSVNLNDPQLTLQIIEDYYNDSQFVSDKPTKIYFGLLIGEGQRKLLTKYSLENRYFIGNTSMDPEICFLMTNLGQVKRGSLVFDPFVGTGSILVACAHNGAYVLGSDIDRKILHGWSKSTRSGQEKRNPDECLRRNMEKYGLGGLYLDLVAADAGRSVWRNGFQCDAIITDPPYGIREGAKKMKTKPTDSNSQDNNKSEPNSKTWYKFHQYPLAELYIDLMRFSALHLVVGGRLVFCFPCMVGDEGNLDALISCVPAALKYITHGSQVFCGNARRFLVCMEKTQSIEMGEEPGVLLSRTRQLSIDKASKVNTFRTKYFTPNSANSKHTL